MFGKVHIARVVSISALLLLGLSMLFGTVSASSQQTDKTTPVHNGGCDY